MPSSAMIVCAEMYWPPEPSLTRVPEKVTKSLIWKGACWVESGGGMGPPGAGVGDTAGGGGMVKIV